MGPTVCEGCGWREGAFAWRPDLTACAECVDHMCFVCKDLDGATAWATVPTALEKLCERCYRLWPWLGGMREPGDPPRSVRLELAQLPPLERKRFKQLHRIVDQSYRTARRDRRYGWRASDDEIRNG